MNIPQFYFLNDMNISQFLLITWQPCFLSFLFLQVPFPISPMFQLLNYLLKRPPQLIYVFVHLELNYPVQYWQIFPNLIFTDCLTLRVHLVIFALFSL